MKKITLFVLSALMVISAASCNSGGEGNIEEKRTMTNHSVYPNGVVLSDSLWQAPETTDYCEKDKAGENIKALFIKTSYTGEDTWAFAYLGIPEGANENNKAPAVLLLHGGAGTAYWEWVKMWRDRGYIALAVDLEGHIPTDDGGMGLAPAQLYTKSQYSAPVNQNYNDSYKPLEDTWMYYAVSTAITANSYLHSLPCADIYKIGVCGVSWGGIITSIISGYDDRFAFSVPIYCTLNVKGSESVMDNYYSSNPEALVWDDAQGLYAVNTPVCFITSNIDPFGTLDAVTKTYEGCKNSTLVIIKDMLHSQAIAAGIYESYYFADSIVKGTNKFAKFTVQPGKGSTQAAVLLQKGAALSEAYLVYTQDSLKEASWSKRRAAVSYDKIDYAVPEGVYAFYLAVTDSNGLTVCSKVVF